MFGHKSKLACCTKIWLHNNFNKEWKSLHQGHFEVLNSTDTERDKVESYVKGTDWEIECLFAPACSVYCTDVLMQSVWNTQSGVML